MQYNFALCVLSVVLGSDWTYPYDESEWGTVSATCSDGEKQSPVNLLEHPGIAQTELSLSYSMATNLMASHEHVLTWDITTESHPKLAFSGMEYSLIRVECRAGSEHTLDGYQYPGSCHFVHQSNSDYVILAVFLSDAAVTTNLALNALIYDLPDADEWVEQELSISFDWNAMVTGLNLEYYWSYEGSFTQPNCDENVQWIVLSDVIEVLPAQIEQIKNVSGFDNNFRPVMPLYGRAVEDGSDIVTTTVMWDVFVSRISEDFIDDLTHSFIKVLGLSDDEAIVINEYGAHGSHSTEIWEVQYGLSIESNTQTFTDDLLERVNSSLYIYGYTSDFSDAIKTQVLADTGTQLKYFFTMSYEVIDSYETDETASEIDRTILVIIIVGGVLLCCLLFAFACCIRKRKLEKLVGLEVQLEGVSHPAEGDSTVKDETNI